MTLDPTPHAPSARTLEIDFLYLDLQVCTRCTGTDRNLEAALTHCADVLQAAGIGVAVRKTLVESEAQARALRFASSPTIRVNGRDIALELRESRCDSCESCVCQGEVDCRVWVHEGREFTEAPTRMIVEALLREAFAPPPPVAEKPAYVLPDNLRHFFSRKRPLTAPPAEEGACCTASERRECCEPSAKQTCCGAAPAEACGCA